MELREVTCPNCGKKVQINIEKQNNFCSQCGCKISEDKPTNSSEVSVDLDEKLEEVAFYYSLSRQKKEAFYKDKNPVYYLKAQDLLLSLSTIFEKDYRIWWELSKPLDYMYEQEVNDRTGVFRFNDNYFDKALDFANISEKKQIILQRDQYEQKKVKIEKEYEEELRRNQEIQEAKEEEERKKKAVEEQRRQEEEKKRKEIEEKKRLEEEELKRVELVKKREQEEELQNQIEYENKIIYEKIESGDYTIIDNTYFNFTNNSGKEYIGVFKLMANVLYLMILCRNPLKNIIFLEQSIAVEVGNHGEIFKFGRKLLRIKENTSSHLTLTISSDGNGGLKINMWNLFKDEKYVLQLLGQAKKPLISLDKIII